MTTCNRCGGVLLANATACRYCGAPVWRGATEGNSSGPLGARQRAQEQWGYGMPSAPDPFAAFPPFPSSGPSFSSQPAGAPDPGEAGAGGQWSAPGLIDASQLPAWLRPPGEGRPASAGGRFDAPGSSGRAPAQSGFPPMSSASTPMSPAPLRQPGTPGGSNSPYLAGGRRSTDDVFGSSSVNDQTRLPADWFSAGRERQARTGMPPARTTSPQPGQRPAQQPGGTDANLPEWLRAMDPGAPPSVGHLTSGMLRPPPGMRDPFGANRSSGMGQSGPSGTGAPESDPFSISRIDMNLPPLDGFGGLGLEGAPSSQPMSNYPWNAPASRPPTGNPGNSSAPRPWAGNPDPFASQSPFGELPGQSAGRFGSTGGQHFPPSGPQRMGTAATGQSPFESQPVNPFLQLGGQFSASSLIEGDALPSWLSSGGSGGAAVGRSPSAPAGAAPRSFGAGQSGESDPGAFGAQPFAAGQSAGSFTGPARPSPFAGGQPGGSAFGGSTRQEPDAFSPFPPSPRASFDAGSLVDEQSLPDWLRSSRDTEPLPLPFKVSNSIGARGADRPRNARGQESAANRAASAADEEELPDWLRQVYADAHVPPLNQSSQPEAPTGQSKISGSDLVDERSIPKWLQEATQTSPLPDFPEEVLRANTLPPRPATSPAWPDVSKPASMAGAYQAASDAPGKEGLTGRSLIDESNLPEWLRAADASGSALAGATPADAASASQPPSQPSGSISGIFSAAELVDTHSLPAWLKSEGQPSASEGESRAAAWQPPSQPSGSASGLFSAAELIDTQSLPAWMRPEEAPTLEKGSQPGPASAPAGSISGIFSAAELINTQSLPAWLRHESSDAPEQGSASGVFSATELVDTQSLPTWLKTEGQGGSEGKTITSKIAAIPAGFSGQQSEGFSAAELVDTKALPAWLKGAVSEAEAAPADQQGQTRDTAGRMSAAELVDTHSLPAWMRGAESGEPALPGSSLLGASFSDNEFASGASGQTGGFSAASLVDQDALPAWLRAAQTGEALGQSQQAPDQSAAEMPQPAWPSSGPMERDPREQSGISGSSLIDQEQVPDWLRHPTSLQRHGSAQEDGPQVRVPHRPRPSGELNRAPSQAAANVFSSVLGPTAGEAPQGQRTPPQREETSSADWGSPPPRRSRPRESGEWGGEGVDTRLQPPAQRSPSRPQRGGFEQGAAASGGWQGDFAGMPESPEAGPGGRRAGARPSGPRSPAQQSWQSGASGEWEEIQDPAARRQSGGMAMPGAAFGSAGADLPQGRGREDYAGYGPAPQRRGPAHQPDYGLDDGGWEGGPDFDLGFASDDDVGPPSGVFAKIRRMLGFG